MCVLSQFFHIVLFQQPVGADDLSTRVLRRGDPMWSPATTAVFRRAGSPDPAGLAWGHAALRFYLAVGQNK